MQHTFAIITFGCQMNVADSTWLARALTERGFAEVPLAEAEVCIVNTCSVREKPEQKVYSALGRIRSENRNPKVFSVVAGCVAQQLGQSLLDSFREVRLVLGTDAWARAPEAIRNLCDDPALRLCLTDFLPLLEERDPALRTAQLPPVSYVNIMQGCDNFCAYCIVPYTRGRQKSRTEEAILDECRMSLLRGAREITLLGQNVNAYGCDIRSETPPDRHRFAALLRSVAALPGLTRLRFVTPHPKDLDDEVIRLFGTLPVLCPRLHLPLQSGSDTILSRMGRKYTRAHFLDLVGRLKKARPGIALSTDLIVGFPTETEDDFRQTLDLVREAGFMSAFSFCYSDRPGTRSQKMTGKIPEEIKLERLSRLQALVESQQNDWLRKLIGQKTTVLIEGPSPRASVIPGYEDWQGKDEWGDTVNISMPTASTRIGDIIPVTITDARAHSLRAERLASNPAE